MPRAGLSEERVVAEAARVADEVGYDALTLASVAGRFGVRLPSLYKHIGGLGALRRLVATLAVRELAEALGRAAVGRSGSDALRALADAYRDYAQQHPGRYAATLRAPEHDNAPLQAASQAVLDIVYAVLGGYALAGEDRVDATRVLRSALHGFVSLEAVGGFGMPQDVDRSFDLVVASLDAAFRSWGSSTAVE